MHTLRAFLVLAVLLLLGGSLRSDELRQEKKGATLVLRADHVEDGHVESKLSSEMLLTLSVEGKAPLKFTPDDAGAAATQVKALRDSAKWFPGGCELVGNPQRTPLSDDRERWEIAIRLDPLMPKDGELELHPASLDYSEAGADKHVEWDPIKVRITTTVASTDVKKEQRDITSIEELPARATWLAYLPWLGLAVAAAGLVAGAWGLRRNLTRKVRPLTAHEWADSAIDRLEALDLPAIGEVDRYHTELGDIVRAYLEKRFQLPASHQTTAEFLETMKKSPHLSDVQRQQLRDFLERCDMAKFARAAPPPEECRAVAVVARSFIRETVPKTVP
jgi:hypothetical protein